MKRFIYRILLFIVLPLLIIVLVCEYSLRNIPNDYAFKNDWMDLHAQSVEIINLGNSHGYFGIEPSLFAYKAFNVAQESQDMKYNHFVFNKYYGKMDSLKVLILPISYSSFLGEGLETNDEKWRVKYYCIYYKCDYHKWELLHNSELYNSLYFKDFHFKDVWFSLLGKADNRRCNDLGRGLWGRVGYQEDGAERARYHTAKKIDSVIVNQNQTYVEDMIVKCAERNVSVVLVTTPTFHTYSDNLNQEQLNLMINCCDYFQQKFSNVTYLNLLFDKRFTIDDFGDADHLNEFGAAKLTHILQQTIDTLRSCE